MSFGFRQPSQPPKVAGITADDAATNQKAVPARWWVGEDWCPLTWLIPQPLNPVYKELREKVGKKTQTTGYEIYADLAGLVGVGLTDAIRAIELSKEVIWTGNIVRPTNPADPNYWRAVIATAVGTFYYYWGRADQPVDDILLGPLGALDASQAHPAYRNQSYIIGKRIAFGQSTSAPSIRVKAHRAPKPQVGNFAKQDHAQGESIVAADLELLTDPIFGAALSAGHFTAAQWEALSAAVIARAGRFSPSLTRERPVRDVIRDHFALFDGWARLEGAKIVPGYFPHDGQVPANLPEISHHDIVGDPDIGAPGLSKQANKVVVTFRDRTQKLREDTEKFTARGNSRVRSRVQPVTVSAPPIVDRDQARAYAAERARTAAEGDSEGMFECRRPKAVDTLGNRLQAGDNFQLDWLPYELDQPSRISRLTDPYRGPIQIAYLAERGVYPLPYAPPAALQPTLGAPLPTEILHARVLELTTQLAGTPIGIRIAVLAQRPEAAHSENAAVKAGNVVGFNLYHSADDVTFDAMGNSTRWAVRGTLVNAINNVTDPLTITVAIPADNLDADRIVPISDEDQQDDTLLLVIGDEVLSVGDVTIDGANLILTDCLRARQGTAIAAALADAEVWLVYRDEIVSFAHKQFIEDQTRYFKPQPYTSAGVVDLGDIDAIEYHFRDRADELPVIALGAPPAAARVGLTYQVTGQISDVNGDLTTYEVTAARIVGGNIDSEITLRSAELGPNDRALFNFKIPVVFPQVGTWRLIARAYDERVGYTEEATADFNVVAGSGAVGEDDGVTPDTVDNVVLTPGLSILVAEWDYPTNTPVARVLIYVSENAVKPADPTAVAEYPQPFYFLQGLPSNAQRYFWFEVEATNGRKSAVAGPFNATTRAGIDLSDIVPGMELVGIVNALPNPVGYTGPNVVLLTTDGKIYRLKAGTWTPEVATVDLTGQIVAGQIADAAVLNAKLADNAVSQSKLQDAIVSAAKLVDAAVTAAKIANDAVTNAKLADNAISQSKLQDAIITAAKLVDDAVTNAKIAAGAVTGTKIADGSISTPKIVAGAITANELAALSVVAGKIAANAITATEIAANAVTAAKIAAGSVTADKVDAGAITTAKLAAGAVTANEIAALAITAGKIAAGAITATEIAAGAITTAKISAGAITANELAVNAVTADKLAANSVVAAKLAAGAVTADKIEANAITSDKIAANAIVAGKIAAAAITAAAIGANEIIANTANIADGIITSAKIASLVADKVSAGTLAAMKLDASLIRSDVQLYHQQDTTRFFPVVGSVFRGSVVAGLSISGLPIHPASPNYYTHDDLIIYGWKQGAVGFSSHRFGNSSMRLQAGFSGNCNPTGADYLIFNVGYRVRTSGGAWGAWQGSQHDNYAKAGSDGNIQYTATWDNIAVTGDNDVQVGISFKRASSSTGGTVGAVNITAFTHNF